MSKGMAITVREHSPLKVDVSDLLQRPGGTKDLSLQATAEGLALPLARVDEGEGLDLRVRLEALVDGIHVTGTVRGEVVLECRRCLRRFRERADVRVDDVFLYPGEVQDQDGETYPIERETVDLEPVVRDEVMLALPANPICREECAGLCPTCGADRNEVDCGHEDKPVDIRWGPLTRLRDRLEG